MIKRIINKLKRIYNYRVLHMDPMEAQIKQWREAGVEIGERCKIYSSLPTGRDAFLLHIGNNVTISGNVKFLMHDNAPIKFDNGAFTDVLGSVSIGDNCFVGYGSIFLPGVSLADNTIVGAGTVVTKSIEREGVCIAGNPAKIICTSEEYYEKNKNFCVNLNDKSISEVRHFYQEYPEKLLHKPVLK